MLTIRFLCVAIPAAVVAGCANAPGAGGILWWPQGPGDFSGPLPSGTERAPLNAVPAAARADSRPSSANRAESQAVRHGDLLFVSGQLGHDTEIKAGNSIETQVRSSMDRVMRILESHGLGSNHILSVTFYLRDIDDLQRADAIYASYFPGRLPARSVAGVDTLPHGSLVEIAVIAGK